MVAAPTADVMQKLQALGKFLFDDSPAFAVK